MEAIQSPGAQSAVADAASVDDAASAQGLAEAAGSAAAAIGAFTAAPLFDALGAGPAWLIAGIVMAVLLATSARARPTPLRRRTGSAARPYPVRSAARADAARLQPPGRITGGCDRLHNGTRRGFS